MIFNSVFILQLIKKYFLIFMLTCNSIVVCYSSHVNEFYSTEILTDGVHELKIFLNGIRVKETVAGPKEGSPNGLVVRQLSTHRQVLYLIYNGIPEHLLQVEGTIKKEQEDHSLVGQDEEGLELRSCRVEKDRKQVKEFIEEFDSDITQMHSHLQDINFSTRPNYTYKSLDEINETIPRFLYPMIRFKDLKHKCFSLNRKIRKLSKAAIGDKQMHINQTDSTSVLKRSRRSLMQLLILPGTKWCGSGQLARSYNDLEGYNVADHCCRVHDLCPMNIPRLSRKFGLYNYGLTTISHCSCDKRFKTCLKQSGTGAADVVGNVFFKIVKSNCFDFRKKKVCKKRGFWSCLRWGYEKQAVMRGPIPWKW